MIIHKIEATTIPDLWFRAVNDILEIGTKHEVDRGSFAGQNRIEYDYFIGHIKNPGFGSGTVEILPDIPAHLGIPNPVEFEFIYGGTNKHGITYERSYVEYVLSSTLQPGEGYTYGSRLTKFPLSKSMLNCFEDPPEDKKLILTDSKIWNHPKIFFKDDIYSEDIFFNQIELINFTYKNYGHRNNQMVLQIATPDDDLLTDPPCLRHIDTRIQDNKLHFCVYFRSWDLWGGLPANLAGIEALQQYMAGQIGVEQGEMIVESKGLHLYGFAEELAKIRCLKNLKGR